MIAAATAVVFVVVGLRMILGGMSGQTCTVSFLVGAVAVFIGVDILCGKYRGRVAGATVAVLALARNMLSLRQNPFTLLIMIAIDITIIWSLALCSGGVTELAPEENL